MTSPVFTKVETDARHGRYIARIEGIDAEGEITFTKRGPKVISADHTGVPDAMAGLGVAKALLGFMLDDARESGFRIIPICPFIRKQYARHPEWSDLFTTAPGEDPQT
ncbi:GNAT family N-acetyltransferase [Aquicoccus sp. G2-2]|jgi:predicted GNAT family acetyltransferase|uniref:GNAT family N-acetyltransferase n=1 Tax=Aquicoccus sp. G2-2 TaxID=3092120 RepID=UPI002ADFBA9E|nr:GNAT family N-acetyltransferase [Aquicoccus sp. G2-2]MEA1114753.1 GNAT family N-acetyltransferase [Aquicoccus sp. G2-2]